MQTIEEDWAFAVAHSLVSADLRLMWSIAATIAAAVAETAAVAVAEASAAGDLYTDQRI